MTASDAIAILECQKSKIGTLKNRVQGSQEFKKWWWDTEDTIRKVYGDQIRHVRKFTRIRYRPPIIGPSTSASTLHFSYVRGLESADAVLSSMIDGIKRFGLAEETLPGIVGREYISQQRLAELKDLRPVDYDLQRLIQLCEEIDISYRNECWHAVAALTRALIDHVPPIFNQKTFTEVANNYGGKSFKGSMQHLQRSLRNIADAHLHTQIRRSESMPGAAQVNFGQDLDVLLGEIVRILK